MINFASVLMALVFVPGFETIAFAIANLPAYFSEVTMATAIAYGPEGWQKLDLYRPPATAGPPLGTVIFFHGGRWTSGARADYRFVGEAFARRGFIAVIPDYAKYPAVRFPVFVEDAAAALAWVDDNIETFGGDRRRIHLCGHSAGAHIAALVATDTHYLARYAKTPQAVIASFAGLAGPYAFEPNEPDLEDMFGPPSRYPEMRATTFIEGREPPMLLAWGAADTVVARFNMERVQAVSEAKGGRVETRVYPELTHIGLLGALTWLNPGGQTVLGDLLAFFRRTGSAR